MNAAARRTQPAPLCGNDTTSCCHGMARNFEFQEKNSLKICDLDRAAGATTSNLGGRDILV